MKRVALIGLGPHAKRIYYPFLTELTRSDSEVSLELVIDLDMNREAVESFLSKSSLKPKHVIYLDSSEQINPDDIHPMAATALREHGIDKVILSTEPKAHKVYLKECIVLGIDVLTDKPVTAPVDVVSSEDAAEEIFGDVKELVDSLETSTSRVLVQCQRRNHNGYRRVFELIESLVTEYDMPVTYASVHHSDGMWNMPDEYFYRENHPYKYGYGKLMHSGYHFVDLITGLLKVSSRAKGKMPDTLELFSQYSRVKDQFGVITADNYRQFFGDETAERFEQNIQSPDKDAFGEVDSYSQIQLSGGGTILTTIQLSLIQSGFSQRAWAPLPEDAYKSNGRIRHEYVNIHLGPLASIQIHSYQSKQIHEQPMSLYDVGESNHFDIYIFRNSNLIGGKAFEKIQFGNEDIQENESDAYIGHNEFARYETLYELIYDKPSSSELRSHLATNRLLSEIYKNHARQTSGKIPFSKFDAKEIL
jgi:predicted dehydrogenase